MTVLLISGNFSAEMQGLQGMTNVFEYTAKAFLKHCEVYFKIRMHPELLHASLLLSKWFIIIVTVVEAESLKICTHHWQNRVFNCTVWSHLTEYTRAKQIALFLSDL